MAKAATDKPRTGSKRRKAPVTTHLYQRGNIWWFRIEVDGKDCRRSLQTADVDEAKIAAARIARDIRNDQKSELHGLTWQRALLNYAETYIDVPTQQLKPASIKRYMCSWRCVSPWLSGKRLSDITVPFLSKFVRERRAQGVTNGTINRDLASIGVVMKLAQRNGHIAVNPVTLFGKGDTRESKFIPNLPTEQLIEQVAQASSSPVFGDIIRMLSLTGCRMQEIVELTVGQIKVENGRTLLHLDKTKNGRERTIALSPEAVAVLRRQPAPPQDCPYVFWRDHRGIGSFQYPSNVFRDCMSQVVRQSGSGNAKVLPFRLHDLRHYWAVSSLVRGVSIYAVSHNLGHSNVVITQKVYLSSLTHDQQQRVLQAYAWTPGTEGSAQSPKNTA